MTRQRLGVHDRPIDVVMEVLEKPIPIAGVEIIPDIKDVWLRGILAVCLWMSGRLIRLQSQFALEMLEPRI